MKNRSKPEKELASFIKSLKFLIKENDRSILNGKELDILIPSEKIGIEFNGNYFHSTKFHDKDYHLDKTLLSNKKNAKVIFCLYFIG